VRVTFVNKYYFPPHLGGIEQSLSLLAGSLARRPGIDVRAIVANEGAAGISERIDGVDVRRLGRAFAYASTPVVPGMATAIRREASRPDPADVLHLQLPYPWGDVSWLSARSGIPTVMTYHSDVVRQRLMLAAYAPILRRVLDRVDRVIVGAPQMIENSPFLRPVAHKCRVVPFAIDVTRFPETPDVLAAAKRLREAHDRPIVLFVGRLVYYKGAEVLLRAMREVDADLVVIGRGPLEAELRESATALGIADRVTWLPPVDDAVLAAWYRAADVFCLPSVARSEAYGLVQLEAHLAATPVVSTDLPTGVPFVNAHEETGLVVPPADAGALASALRRILGDDAARTRMGERARQRVLTQFTLDRMVDNTLSVYDEALGRKDA
jgi:glycosyltransferase involved in cell wall biosynthesis